MSTQPSPPMLNLSSPAAMPPGAHSSTPAVQEGEAQALETSVPRSPFRELLMAAGRPLPSGLQEVSSLMPRFMSMTKPSDEEVSFLPVEESLPPFGHSLPPSSLSSLSSGAGTAPHTLLKVALGSAAPVPGPLNRHATASTSVLAEGGPIDREIVKDVGELDVFEQSHLTLTKQDSVGKGAVTTTEAARKVSTQGDQYSEQGLGLDVKTPARTLYGGAQNLMMDIMAEAHDMSSLSQTSIAAEELRPSTLSGLSDPVPGLVKNESLEVDQPESLRDSSLNPRPPSARPPSATDRMGQSVLTSIDHLDEMASEPVRLPVSENPAEVEGLRSAGKNANSTLGNDQVNTEQGAHPLAMLTAAAAGAQGAGVNELRQPRLGPERLDNAHREGGRSTYDVTPSSAALLASQVSNQNTALSETVSASRGGLADVDGASLEQGSTAGNLDSGEGDGMSDSFLKEALSQETPIAKEAMTREAMTKEPGLLKENLQLTSSTNKELGGVAANTDASMLFKGESKDEFKPVSAESLLRGQALSPSDRGMQELSLTKGQEHWGNALSERITLLAAKDIPQVIIHLDPPELGSLELKLQINEEQKTQVQVSVQNSHVKEALESSAVKLREMLEKEGLELSEFDVQTQGERQAASGDGQQESPEEGADDESQGWGDEAAEPVHQPVGLLDTYV